MHRLGGGRVSDKAWALDNERRADAGLVLARVEVRVLDQQFARLDHGVTICKVVDEHAEGDHIALGDGVVTPDGVLVPHGAHVQLRVPEVVLASHQGLVVPARLVVAAVDVRAEMSVVVLHDQLVGVLVGIGCRCQSVGGRLVGGGTVEEQQQQEQRTLHRQANPSTLVTDDKTVTVNRRGVSV